MDLQDQIHDRLVTKYAGVSYYNRKIVNRILHDSQNHQIVATFKDYLIYDDCSTDFLKEYYTYEQSTQQLPKLWQFYLDYAEIFPSYALLIQPCEDESTRIKYNKEGVARYMYKNIRKKQKVIDEKYSHIEKKQRMQEISGRGGENANRDLPMNQLFQKQFFTPEYWQSCLKFEKSILKNERLNYYKRVTFKMKMSELLDEYILQDTYEESAVIKSKIGKIQEPLFFSDAEFQRQLKRESSKFRHITGSTKNDALQSFGVQKKSEVNQKAGVLSPSRQYKKYFESGLRQSSNLKSSASSKFPFEHGRMDTSPRIQTSPRLSSTTPQLKTVSTKQSFATMTTTSKVMTSSRSPNRILDIKIQKLENYRQSFRGIAQKQSQYQPIKMKNPLKENYLTRTPQPNMPLVEGSTAKKKTFHSKKSTLVQIKESILKPQTQSVVKPCNIASRQDKSHISNGSSSTYDRLRRIGSTPQMKPFSPQAQLQQIARKDGRSPSRNVLHTDLSERSNRCVPGSCSSLSHLHQLRRSGGGQGPMVNQIKESVVKRGSFHPDYRQPLWPERIEEVKMFSILLNYPDHRLSEQVIRKKQQHKKSAYLNPLVPKGKKKGEEVAVDKTSVNLKEMAEQEQGKLAQEPSAVYCRCRCNCNQ